MFAAFQKGTCLSEIANPKQGLATGKTINLFAYGMKSIAKSHFTRQPILYKHFIRERNGFRTIKAAVLENGTATMTVL